MVALFIAGFLGGAVRALAGYVNHKEKKVELSYLFSTMISEGILGMFFALLVYDTGLITVAGYWQQLFALGMTAYMGADLINSAFVILFKKRVHL